MLAAMVATRLFPGLQETAMGQVRESLEAGGLSPVAEVYASRDLLSIVAVTLGANLIVGSLATITLPSLIVPYSGLLLGAIRAVAWGVLFSPDLVELTFGEIAAGAFVAGLLLLEGQGYVLAMLAAWVQGRAVLRPQGVSASGYWPALRHGLKVTLQIYLGVALVLIAAALYEAGGALWLLPALE
jgi:hypothetical protein